MKAVKCQTNYSATPKKSVLQSKSMKQCCILHLNDTADYKLGLGVLEESGLCWRSIPSPSSGLTGNAMSS